MFELAVMIFTALSHDLSIYSVVLADLHSKTNSVGLLVHKDGLIASHDLPDLSTLKWFLVFQLWSWRDIFVCVCSLKDKCIFS